MKSSNDFDDQRAKGLCFWCDEKYEVGHNCKRNQLYLVEVRENSEEEREQDGYCEQEIVEDEIRP